MLRAKEAKHICIMKEARNTSKWTSVELSFHHELEYIQKVLWSFTEMKLKNYQYFRPSQNDQVSRLGA